MSEYRDVLAHQSNSQVWRALGEYVAERRSNLVAVCCSRDSSEVQIRMAQAAIDELDELMRLPQRLRSAEKHARQGGGY